MKYKVGDKVRIRSDLKAGKRYGDDNFTKNMEQFKGKLVTIMDVVCAYEPSYNIKEDGMRYFWTDEMIECKVYDNIDEFWDNWKNEKVGIRFNSDNEFSSFINDYHFKHFNITCPKGDIINFDTLNYIMIYDKNIPDKWNWVNNKDGIIYYNVITYDDFIKLVEKEESNNLEESINNVEKTAEDKKPTEIDKWDKNVPAENIDGMGTFESEFSNKNHILKENKIDKELNEKVEEEYKYILNSIRNKKEFDWNAFKNNKVSVILRSDEEAKDFFTKMYNEFNINECVDYYKNKIMFDEHNSEFKIYYNKYIDCWCVDSHNKCFINWSDYMDKENTTQILKNILGEPHVEKVVDTSIYKRIDNTKQDIKQAFVDIDTSVLYTTRELFDIIRHEKDIEKIKNILNIIDRLIITKNKVLNDFDIYMIDELNEEG